MEHVIRKRNVETSENTNKIFSAISINTHLDCPLPSEVPILPTANSTGSISFKMKNLLTKYTLVKPVFLNDKAIKLPNDIEPQCEAT